MNVLVEIADMLEKRKNADPKQSYTAQLLQSGEDAILKKIIEEAGEVLMASKDKNNGHLVKEIADVWFHSLVLLNFHGLRPEDVFSELINRQGLSGIEEKSSR